MNDNKYWQFVRDGWPVIAAILVVSWGIMSIVADKYISDIVAREHGKNLITEPVITDITNDITEINGALDNLEGNDSEIRSRLDTVVSRLDTLISIQLQDH